MTSETRPRVFVARIIPDEGLAPILAQTDADVWPDELPPPRDELLRRVTGVDGFLALLTDVVDDELLDRAGPQLRVVSNYAVGFDNIDVPACTRRGVAVGNTAGVLTETTADATFALLMAAARRIPEAYDYVRQDRWKTWGPMLLLGPDVHHATLGILGFGRIGREMAKRARGFEIRDTVAPMSAPIRNASIDFSSMTTSVVAIVTDAVRDGRRVIGFGFNSN